VKLISRQHPLRIQRLLESAFLIRNADYREGSGNLGALTVQQAFEFFESGCRRITQDDRGIIRIEFSSEWSVIAYPSFAVAKKAIVPALFVRIFDPRKRPRYGKPKQRQPPKPCKGKIGHRKPRRATVTAASKAPA
jgi:hypothetical protein